MEKKVIWSNYNLDYEDWKDFFDDEYPDLDEDKRIDLMYELNNVYLDDERMNLDIPVSEEIIVLGDLGLWNGRKSGYKEIQIACIQIPTTQRGISMAAVICAAKPFIMTEPTITYIEYSSRT